MVSSIVDELSAIPKISLPDLNEAASLQTRIDRKYVANADVAGRLLSDLAKHAHVLDIDGETQHAYSSTYWDTPERTSYLLAAHGRRRRFKVRVRRYEDSQRAFLEVKTRGTRGITVKDRCEIPFDASRHSHLPLSALVWVHARLLEARCQISVENLQVALDGSYTRSTVLIAQTDSAAASRLTIDQDLIWRDPEGKTLCGEQMVVIETKAGTRPGLADRWLWRQGIRPQRMSKYATALAALHPELPDNRWNRTLNRHFRERNDAEHDSTFEPSDSLLRAATHPNQSSLAA